MTIGHRSCRSSIGLNALDHRGHSVGALWGEVFFKAQLIELAERIVAHDFLHCQRRKHHEDHGNQAFDDDRVTVALQVKLFAVWAIDNG